MEMVIWTSSVPSFADDKISWYENDGNQNFIADTITTGAAGASSVYAADVDGDGDMDVLSASLNDNKIAWYENDGFQSFTVHAITLIANWPRSVHAADLDGDGDMDVLSASQHDDRIAWYENDSLQNFTTGRRSLQMPMGPGLYMPLMWMEMEIWTSSVPLRMMIRSHGMRSLVLRRSRFSQPPAAATPRPVVNIPGPHPIFIMIPY